MIEKPYFVSDPILHLYSSIEALQNITTSNASPSPYFFLIDIDPRIEKIDQSELRFLDREKIDEIANSELPQVIMVVIPNQALTELLVDTRRSCNVLYEDALDPLGLRQIDLNPFDGEDLLAFNDLVTRPYGVTDLTFSIG